MAFFVDSYSYKHRRLSSAAVDPNGEIDAINKNVLE
jgi:hypothetical protein